MTRPTVELHNCFWWACDSCGRDNFERAITRSVESLDDEDRATLEAMIDSADGEFDGVYLVAPDEVTCRHCGATFEAEDA